jgi:PAS domain S-box-containing protein
MLIDNWLKVVMDSLYDGILIADMQHNVQYVNPSYTRITGVSYKEIVGKKLVSVRPGAMLPEVIDSGKKMLRQLRTEHGIDYVVNMSPIVNNNVIVGGVSVVTEINDAYKLSQELSKYSSQFKRLENRVREIQKAKYTFDDIVCVDPVSVKIKNIAMKVGNKEVNILLTGESGTGKELYAHAIHNESMRSEEPFVAINCASLEATLLESELFGYDEGAFTGAKKGGKTGIFEVAHGGTVFLDEISEIDYGLQSKLLRVLQEGMIRRVGGVFEVPVDVRIIAATNTSLDKLTDEGKFRGDLYYRIAIFPIVIPALRERKRDIPALIEEFLRYMQRKIGHKITVSGDALEVFMGYDWPGNIRELRNVVEFSSHMTENFIIRAEHLPPLLLKKRIEKEVDFIVKPLSVVTKEAEINQIQLLLKQYGRSVQGKKKVAKELSISLATLYNKLKEYKI